METSEMYSENLEVIPEQTPFVFGFMHIAMHGNWKAIVNEQFVKLSSSGLYERTKRLFVTLLGASPEDFCFCTPKVQIIHTSSDFHEYELPTLKFLHSFVQNHDGLVFYIHSKGVFSDSPQTRDWRHLMEHVVIERFRECMAYLKSHDVCGANWLERPWPHFSGNFWWARASYVRTLTPPDTLPIVPVLDHGQRHTCERWIGTGNPRPACLMHSGLDHYFQSFPQDAYICPETRPPTRLPHLANPAAETPLSPIAGRPIFGFIHVAMANHWRQILNEQFLKMRASGLWDRTDRIFVGLIGPQPQEFESCDPKVTVAISESDYRLAEMATLCFLQQHCKTHHCLVYYLHTKGVFRTGPGQEQWRRAMEHFIILRHRDCLAALESHDTCGINFGRCDWCQFYGGNFWWARSEYIRTLPDIRTLEPLPALEPSPRHIAERWIGENPSMRPASLHNTRTDHYANEPYPRSRYASAREVLLNEHFHPGAWSGLENRFQDLLESIGPIRLVVELGVDYGFSAFCLATALPTATVIGVDPYECLPVENKKQSVYPRIQGVVSGATAESWVEQHRRVFPNFVLLRTTASEASKIVSDPIDVLHINAFYTPQDVKHNFDQWEPLVRPGGCVLFHATRSFPDDVGRFFCELLGRKAEIQESHGLGAWYKPEADDHRLREYAFAKQT
jgi:hypothetical protein